MGDPKHARIISILTRVGEVTPCEIAQITGLSPYSARRLLRIMEKQGLVGKSGKRVCRVTGTKTYIWRAIACPRPETDEATTAPNTTESTSVIPERDAPGAKCNDSGEK